MIPNQIQQKNYNSPTLTVALPVYNGEKTLSAAISSLLNQSFQDFELIILDDCSQDKSVEIVRSFKDSRIHLIEGDENLGISARLNMAIDMANGKYFARMDSDDIAFPDRFLKQINYLEKHREVDLLGSNILVFSEGGVIKGVLPIRKSHDEICEKPWGGFYLPHPTWIGKVSWFSEYRYDSNADGAEDQHLLFRTYQDSCFACLEEPLLAYREYRSLKKMFKARRIFLKVFVSTAIQNRNFFIAIKIVYIQAMKVVADILSQYLNIPSLRNPLNKPSLDCLNQWKQIFHKKF